MYFLIIIRYVRIKKMIITLSMKATGIDNLGNTCYLNSALQTLFFTPSLTNLIIHNKEQFVDVRCNVFKNYTLIVNELFSKNIPDKTTLRDFMTAFLKEHPHFQNMRKHHDAHETLMSIIDSLDEAIKPLDFMKQIFDTKMVREIKCTSCGHVVKSNMNYRHYSVDYSVDSIQKGLDSQFEEESLDGYKCDKCKKETCKSIKTIKYTPHVLIVNINMYDMFGRKQKHEVNIDETITMGDKQYILYATLCHHGSSQYGHYTANCISRGVKYFIDDESVTVNEKNFTYDAYSMLYKLKK